MQKFLALSSVCKAYTLIFLIPGAAIISRNILGINMSVNVCNLERKRITGMYICKNIPKEYELAVEIDTFGMTLMNND